MQVTLSFPGFKTDVSFFVLYHVSCNDKTALLNLYCTFQTQGPGGNQNETGLAVSPSRHSPNEPKIHRTELEIFSF